MQDELLASMHRVHGHLFIELNTASLLFPSFIRPDVGGKTSSAFPGNFQKAPPSHCNSFFSHLDFIKIHWYLVAAEVGSNDSARVDPQKCLSVIPELGYRPAQ